MPDKMQLAAEVLALKEGEKPAKEKSVEITADHMNRWNKLISWSKEKGYAGRPELDHDENLRNKVFMEFNKANPDYAIPIELVKPIQNEIQAYKSKALDLIKQGKGLFKGEAKDFMKGISQVDGIFGQLTSQWAFPEAYIVNKATGEKQNKGFAPLVPITALK